eukprot:COSAG01_NODE_3004_length_6735_cov_44.599759_6_plen_40_part_00
MQNSQEQEPSSIQLASSLAAAGKSAYYAPESKKGRGGVA